MLLQYHYRLTFLLPTHRCTQPPLLPLHPLLMSPPPLGVRSSTPYGLPSLPAGVSSSCPVPLHPTGYPLCQPALSVIPYGLPFLRTRTSFLHPLRFLTGVLHCVPRTPGLPAPSSQSSVPWSLRPCRLDFQEKR